MNVPIHIIKIAYISCYRCGIEFGVPEDYDRARVRDHRSFYCPNGHGQHYPRKKMKGASAEEIEARRQRIRELHEQEQAEARAADKDAAPAVDPLDVLNRVTRDDRNRFVCPECGKKYKYLKSFRNHMGDHNRALLDALETVEGLRAIGIIGRDK